jgi:pimeloyl-ACP methyl ester carboxylesterase
MGCGDCSARAPAAGPPRDGYLRRMPKLSREDGVEIHWEERGDGRLAILAPYWSGHPSALDPIAADLLRDHRVLRYDARGTGESTRKGPHDVETAAADLAAIAEAAGGDAVVLTLADACPRAVRVAAASPDLVKAVVAPGSAPLLLEVIRGTDALLSSETVIDAFIEMIRTDYRGALRTLMTQTNPQMDEEGVRARVNAQAEYCPAETALGRVQAWLADDSAEQGRAIGDRLVIVYSEEMGGAWLPAGDEMSRRVSEHLPEARLEQVEDGIVSRPDLTAAIVRSLSSPPGTEGEK